MYFQAPYAEHWPCSVPHRGKTSDRWTFSSVIHIDPNIFRKRQNIHHQWSVQCEWCSAAADLEPAKTCWWDFWGEQWCRSAESQSEKTGPGHAGVKGQEIRRSRSQTDTNQRDEHNRITGQAVKSLRLSDVIRGIHLYWIDYCRWIYSMSLNNTYSWSILGLTVLYFYLYKLCLYWLKQCFGGILYIFTALFSEIKYLRIILTGLKTTQIKYIHGLEPVFLSITGSKDCMCFERIKIY